MKSNKRNIRQQTQACLCSEAVHLPSSNPPCPTAAAAHSCSREDNAPTPATTPGGEGKKGVSWGTVKTHKVYIVDSDGDDNGKEVRAN